MSSDKIKSLKSQQAKVEEVVEKTNSLKTSFWTVFGLATGSVFFISFFQIMISNRSMQLFLGLQAILSVITACFYFFYARFSESSFPVDWKSLLLTRYKESAVSIPLIILSLVFLLSYNRGDGKDIPFNVAATVALLALQYGSLLLQFLGDQGQIDKNLALASSSVLLLVLFCILFFLFLFPLSSSFSAFPEKYAILAVYFLLSVAHQVAYSTDMLTRNSILNILDFLTKCLVGILVGVYVLASSRVI